MTIDEYSGNEIRKTDNTLKDEDWPDTPQHPRPLTQDEIDELLEVIANDNA